MIVSNNFGLNAGFSSANQDYTMVAHPEQYNIQAMNEAETSGQTQRSSKVFTAPDGSTILQHTTLSPSGAIMRKNITLAQAGDFPSDPTDSGNMLRRRSEAYEGMMMLY